MYGGRGKEIFNQMCILDLQTWQWKVLYSLPLLPEGRYGHTANMYILIVI